MNTIKTVYCATSIIYIFFLTENCFSINVQNNVQFILSESKYVHFVKKLQQPDLKVQFNNNINKLRNPDNLPDIPEEKDGTTQQVSPNIKYSKMEEDNNSKGTLKSRMTRQINNGYTSIYPSLPTFNSYAQNMNTTSYKNPGAQYNRSSFPQTNSYNYPSNVNAFNNLPNYNRYPQNSTFQANVPPFNYSTRPSYYPYGQNPLINNSTYRSYSPNNWYNQSDIQKLNPNNYLNYNYSYNYSYDPHQRNQYISKSIYSNTTNFNSSSHQPNYNPVYKSSQATNFTFNSQPFRSNFSSYNISPNKGLISNSPVSGYPEYRPVMIHNNFRSNNSGVSNYSQNVAFNPYYTPKTQISNQSYPVNPTYYNSNHINQQINSQYNQQNNPQNNSYFTSNKNRFNDAIGRTTLREPFQNNLPYNATYLPTNVYNYNIHLNQSSYTQTTPISTPYFRPNSSSHNHFGVPNQSNWTEPRHFFYIPGGNKFNGTANVNLPHKYYK